MAFCFYLFFTLFCSRCVYERHQGCWCYLSTLRFFLAVFLLNFSLKDQIELDSYLCHSLICQHIQDDDLSLRYSVFLLHFMYCKLYEMHFASIKDCVCMRFKMFYMDNLLVSLLFSSSNTFIMINSIHISFKLYCMWVVATL